MQRTFDCLCCVAHLCKRMSWKSLNMKSYCFPTPETLHPFVSMLNNSLHNSQSIEHLTLHFTSQQRQEAQPVYPRYLHSLASALRKDQSLPHLNLRRSESLHNLATDVCDRPLSLHRSYSCPDLLELESLHSLHPLLSTALQQNGILRYYQSNVPTLSWTSLSHPFYSCSIQ